MTPRICAGPAHGGEPLTQPFSQARAYCTEYSRNSRHAYNLPRPDCGCAQKEDRELAKLQEQERIRSGKELAAAKRIEEQQQACLLTDPGP